MNVKRHRFGDKRAQDLSERWYKLDPSDRKLDLVAEAYVVHILGLSEEAFSKFMEGDSGAYEKVGRVQSAVPFKDGKAFWEKMKELFPRTFQDEDMEFLIGECDVFAVLHFLNALQPAGRETNRSFIKLASNAHVYK